MAVGTRLGSHEILGLLGAGGMGEVYLAQDTRLNRRVAIKVLPEAYASDPDRNARFHREAQAVAALNHPGIAAIYELAESDALTFFVLELVEGDTLADRLRRGPLPVDQALAFGRQILEALEAAHDKGICHRDLKPANVKLTLDGAVKVLDFGLAKFVGGGAASASLTHSPTMSLAGTFPGVILGTAGYMSPEQANGFEADQRSDIFSFGCILYELLTGQKAFEGTTPSEILAGVIKSEVDFSRLPPRLNPRLVELLRRCLEKNPKKRWHAAADVRVEIESVLAQGAIVDSQSAPVVRRPMWQRLASAVTLVLVGVAAGGYLAWSFKPEPARPITRFSVSLPEGQAFTASGRHLIALSPDGANLVYVANNRLILRPMSGLDSRVIPGSDMLGAIQEPAFSPDGQWIVFRAVAESALKRIPVAGGAAVTICQADQPFGISWGEGGILFGQQGKGILRVSPNGGVPEVLVPANQDEMVDAPHWLADRKAVLFSSKKATDSWDKGQVVVYAIDDGVRKVVLDGGADATYVPTAHLVYAVSGVLFAVPFDVRTFSLKGGPVSVVEGVRRTGGTGFSGATAHYVVSSNGSLAFVPGPTSGPSSFGALDLAIFDATRPPVPLKLPPGPYAAPRVSPDGRWVAFEREDEKGANVTLYELAGTSAIRQLTFGGRNRAPIWSGDSQWIAFQSDRDGDVAIFRQRADGTGTAQRLTKPDAGSAHIPQSWSPDGAHLLFTVGTDRQFSLWNLALKDRRTSPFSDVRAPTLVQATFSPDGRWVAYQLPSPGGAGRGSANSTYVEPFPPNGSKYVVPMPAGHPYWSRKGDRLLFENGPVTTGWIPVTTAPAFSFGRSQESPRGQRISSNSVVARRNSDSMPDGRILGLLAGGAQAIGSEEITVVLNWFDELRERVR